MAHWSDPHHAAPTRFRLRVGRDEEFALPKGVTLVGRDVGCPIRIVDSLVSRRHARIECDGESATLEDLGSRNGTRINDLVISGERALRDGDRIGIGSAEIVISVVDELDNSWQTPPTGVQSLCDQCRFCFEAGTPACPRCGAPRPAPLLPEALVRTEETSYAPWSVSMLLEMTGKAILMDNLKDAEKLMRRASVIVGDHLRANRPLTPEELRGLEEAGRWIDARQRDHTWSDWYARVCVQLRRTP